MIYSVTEFILSAHLLNAANKTPLMTSIKRTKRTWHKITATNLLLATKSHKSVLFLLYTEFISRIPVDINWRTLEKRQPQYPFNLTSRQLTINALETEFYVRSGDGKHWAPDGMVTALGDSFGQHLLNVTPFSRHTQQSWSEHKHLMVIFFSVTTFWPLTPQTHSSYRKNTLSICKSHGLVAVVERTRFIGCCPDPRQQWLFIVYVWTGFHVQLKQH